MVRIERWVPWELEAWSPQGWMGNSIPAEWQREWGEGPEKEPLVTSFPGAALTAWSLAVILCFVVPAGGLPAVQRQHAPQVRDPQLQGPHLLRPLWLLALGPLAAGAAVQR